MNMASKTAQNTIGAVLLSTGPVILWFVCEHYFRNYAAYLGELTGLEITLHGELWDLLLIMPANCV